MICRLFLQEIPEKFLYQIVPFDMPDEVSGVVVTRNIGGIAGKNVADHLIDGIVTLLLQCVVHSLEDVFRRSLITFYIIQTFCVILKKALQLFCLGCHQFFRLSERIG